MTDALSARKASVEDELVELTRAELGLDFDDTKIGRMEMLAKDYEKLEKPALAALPTTAADLAKRLDITRGQALRLLARLRQRGDVEQHAENVEGKNHVIVTWKAVARG